jgi:hypothetical protein
MTTIHEEIDETDFEYQFALAIFRNMKDEDINNMYNNFMEDDDVEYRNNSTMFKMCKAEREKRLK